jgi:hypothetical protein
VADEETKVYALNLFDIADREDRLDDLRPLLRP